MFLVTGITGHVGGAAAKNLLAQGKSVRALVRDPGKAARWKDQGVELVEGTWQDAGSIARALRGVEGAYLMVPPLQVPSPDFSEAKAIVASYTDALAQAPPPKVVALSSMGSEQTHGLGLITSTHVFEQGLRDQPFPVAFIRAGSFYENYLYGLQAAQGGTLPVMYTPTDLPTPMIATDDIGALVAKLLTSSWTGRRIIELGSLRTADQLAAELGKALGREVKAQAIPRNAWAATLQGMGLPEGGTWAYEEMIDGINSGWIHFGVPGTERVEGTTSAEAVFRAAAAKG